MSELINRIKNAQFSGRKFLLILCPACGLLCLLLFLSGPFSSPEETPPPPTGTPVPTLVTAEQMSRLFYTDSVMGELHWELAEDSLEELNRVLWEYQILAPEEISQFLAQVTVETVAGTKLTEAGDESYFQSKGYTSGTRGAGYLHLTHEYGQMAFSTWMMKKYVPELSAIAYQNPSNHGRDEISAAYYAALQTAANLGLDVSRYSRIVYESGSPVTTGADYIAQTFAWESAAYYWHIAGIGEALSPEPGVDNVDVASERIGGGNWQSRREAYTAFYPVLSGQPS